MFASSHAPLFFFFVGCVCGWLPLSTFFFTRVLLYACTPRRNKDEAHMQPPLVYVYAPPQYRYLAPSTGEGAAAAAGVFEVGCIVPCEGAGVAGGFPALFRNHLSTNVLFVMALIDKFDINNIDDLAHRRVKFERTYESMLPRGVIPRPDLGTGHVHGRFGDVVESILAACRQVAGCSTTTSCAERMDVCPC